MKYNIDGKTITIEKTEKEVINRKFKTSFLYLSFFFMIGIEIWLFFVDIIAFYFGIFGCVINFVVDYGIWFKIMKTRVISNYPHPFRFFLLFMVYGISQFCYSIILFQNDLTLKIIYSVLIFVGLTIIGEISKNYGKHSQKRGC